jgi:hypothetical protein
MANGENKLSAFIQIAVVVFAGPEEIGAAAEVRPVLEVLCPSMIRERRKADPDS